MKWKRFLPYTILALTCTSIGYFMGQDTRFATSAQRTEELSARLSHSIDKLAKSSSTNQSYQELSDRLDQLHGNDRIAYTVAQVDRMDLAAVQKMAREILASGGDTYSLDGVNIQQMLIDKWAELDPQSLMEEGFKQNSYARDRMVGAAFGALARIDFTNAWSQAQQLDGLNRTLATDAILGILTDEDPISAIAFFNKNSALINIPEEALFKVVSRWAQKDPIASADYINSLPDSPQKVKFMRHVLELWSVKNPDQAIAWADKFDSPFRRGKALNDIANTLSSSDPQKLLVMMHEYPEFRDGLDYAMRNLAAYDFDQAKNIALSLKNPVQKRIALVALTAGGTDYNIAELLKLASSLPIHEAKSIYSSDSWWSREMSEEDAKKWIDHVPDGPLRENARQNMVAKLARNDPKAAAKMFDNLPDSLKNGDYLAEYIAAGLSRDDPQKALAWANELGTFSLQKNALSSIFVNLAETSPSNAAKQLASITDPAMKMELAGGLASRWAATDFEAAKKWANTLQGEEKNRALSSMANSLARSNPEQSQAIVEQLVRQNSADFWKSSENREVISQISAQVADTDPQAAAKWIEKLPTGAAQDSGYASLVRTWAVYAPDAAGTWLNQMPAGETRNQATSNYVQTIARTDPEGAYDWAVSIDDSTMRREAAKQALMSWKENGGKEQAMQSIQQNTQFTEQERAELIKAIE